MRDATCDIIERQAGMYMYDSLVRCQVERLHSRQQPATQHSRNRNRNKQSQKFNQNKELYILLTRNGNFCKWT